MSGVPPRPARPTRLRQRSSSKGRHSRTTSPSKVLTNAVELIERTFERVRAHPGHRAPTASRRQSAAPRVLSRQPAVRGHRDRWGRASASSRPPCPSAQWRFSTPRGHRGTELELHDRCATPSAGHCAGRAPIAYCYTVEMTTLCSATRSVDEPQPSQPGSVILTCTRTMTT